MKFMAMIETLEQAILRRREECTNEASHDFSSAVRPIYASLDGRHLESIGSSLLLNIDRNDYVITAAHIIDWINTHAIYIGGTLGTEPVQIDGTPVATTAPNGDREQDRFDFAFCKIPEEAKKRLGAVHFIDESRISRNQASAENRYFLVMGYPIVKNDKMIDFSHKTIGTLLSKYTGGVNNSSGLAKKLGVSGDEHFFITFKKFAVTDDGNQVRSFKPKGISGGALVDLGNFATIEKFDPKSKCVGMLSGMIIEHHPEHQALVAIRIEYIVKEIRAKS